MTVEEIFQKLANHMAEGVMFHDMVSKIYEFLNLYGFSKEHEYHHVEEDRGYRKLIHYYSTRFLKLIDVGEVPAQKLIPETWYKYTALAMDTNTKRQTIKELVGKWVNWEKETKKLYEEMYQELTNLREIAAAAYLQKYIEDVDEELKHAIKEQIKYETINYDIVMIIDWQEEIEDKFKKKLKHLYK